MKLAKRILAVCIAALLTFGMFTVGASAAVPGEIQAIIDKYKTEELENWARTMVMVDEMAAFLKSAEAAWLDENIDLEAFDAAVGAIGDPLQKIADKAAELELYYDDYTDLSDMEAIRYAIARAIYDANNDFETELLGTFQQYFEMETIIPTVDFLGYSYEVNSKDTTGWSQECIDALDGMKVRLDDIEAALRAAFVSGEYEAFEEALYAFEVECGAVITDGIKSKLSEIWAIAQEQRDAFIAEVEAYEAMLRAAAEKLKEIDEAWRSDVTPDFEALEEALNNQTKLPDDNIDRITNNFVWYFEDVVLPDDPAERAVVLKNVEDEIAERYAREIVYYCQRSLGNVTQLLDYTAMNNAIEVVKREQKVAAIETEDWEQEDIDALNGLLSPLDAALLEGVQGGMWDYSALTEQLAIFDEALIALLASVMEDALAESLAMYREMVNSTDTTDWKQEDLDALEAFVQSIDTLDAALQEALASGKYDALEALFEVSMADYQSIVAAGEANKGTEDDEDDGDDEDPTDPVIGPDDDAWKAELARYNALIAELDRLIANPRITDARMNELKALRGKLAADAAALIAARNKDALKALTDTANGSLNTIKGNFNWIDKLPAWLGWMKIKTWPAFLQGVMKYVFFGWIWRYFGKA